MGTRCRPEWGIEIWDSATGIKVSKNLIDAESQEPFAFSPDGALLISGSRDATALIWDLTGIADEKGAKTLTSERLALLWEELADAIAGKAWRAGWRLAADPTASVPFIQRAYIQPKLRPLVSPCCWRHWTATPSANEGRPGLG